MDINRIPVDDTGSLEMLSGIGDPIKTIKLDDSRNLAFLTKTLTENEEEGEKRDNLTDSLLLIESVTDDGGEVNKTKDAFDPIFVV
uniref:Uncharacterized protein n=1 Tax=Strongyloides papillosus TaxID=174720 RepID=A0A0N5C5W1_STREA